MAFGRYVTPCAAPGKAKSQGGSSTGKAAKLNNSGLMTPAPKNFGTPKDKGVNK